MVRFLIVDEPLKPGDQIWIGPVGPIPVVDENDPTVIAERLAWHEATARAQALITVDDHLSGLSDPDWRCRYEVIDRLVARGKEDPRTLRALLKALQSDPAWQVRDSIVLNLLEFPAARVEDSLRRALHDQHPEVRDSARYALDQLYLPPSDGIRM